MPPQLTELCARFAQYSAADVSAAETHLEDFVAYLAPQIFADNLSEADVKFHIRKELPVHLEELARCTSEPDTQAFIVSRLLADLRFRLRQAQPD